jgi:hypothetical protein
MIIPNREWSLNLTRESLLKDIDIEIQKEYQILNKFSTEKFSLLLVLFGILTIFVMIWPRFSFGEEITFYLIAACILIFFWTYWNWILILLKIFKIPLIDRESDFVDTKPFNLGRFDSHNEREQFINQLKSDWSFAKKGGPHFQVFSIFLGSVACISYANVVGWICIPHLNDSVILGITIAELLIFFSIVVIITTINPDIYTKFLEMVPELLKLSEEKNINRKSLILKGMGLIILGAFLTVFWSIFFYIFPLILIYWFIIPNWELIIGNFPNNLVILLLLVLFLHYFIEFLVIPFGISLVESVKNEKIWWLETLKIENISY